MSRTVALALLACVFVAGCKRHAHASASDHVRPDPCARQRADGPLRWIADDYSAALACARKQHVPLVLDLWAPWCHTCLSMRATVLRDPSFGGDRDRFVFAALDTDRPENADVLSTLVVPAWPTFYVLGDDEVVLARFVGSASVAQFHELLDSAASAARGAPEDRASAHLLGADRALALGDYQTAEEDLTATLSVAPPSWERRPEVLGALILATWRRGDLPGCLEVAEKYLDDTGNAAVASDFLVTAMACAHALEHPSGAEPPATGDQQTRIHALRARAVARWRALLADTTAPLSLDDRSDAMLGLREALDALGEHDQALKVAEGQRALLDAAAAKAPDAMTAMTYDWPRAEVYVYLGRPLELVPALEQSARALPGQYDPSARLGWLFFQANRLELAAKWTDAALRLVYGPRKGELLTQRAKIAAAAGDRANERLWLDQAVKLYQSLPPSQADPDALAAVQASLAALGPS